MYPESRTQRSINSEMALVLSTQPQKYEVFLSFRGEDTRHSFVSHLYTALNQRGIITYMDEHNLKKGQSISSELLKSIEESKFSIIIFSKNYTSSMWCLDELVKIMECRSKHGQTVIPIFYDVNPSSLRKHVINFNDNMVKAHIWKEKLREAANISGLDLTERNVPEAACIAKIVREIFGKLPRKAAVKGLVGIEDRVKKLSTLLGREPNDVCFVGIWGMGGIGKTTTARATFDELIGGFDGGCFLQDVCKRNMVNLQNILLSKVLKLEDVNITDEYEGSNMIRSSLCLKRVLLVLDDVNDIKQLNSLAGEREWFGSGSRIVITTRDNQLLNEVNGTYKVDYLSKSESTELFCWHAFKMSYPARNFAQLSEHFVSYACGLPLALEVLGSQLRGQGIDVWESTLARLKDAPEDKIIAALKISFEGLNDIQQDIFLDIACFFRGHLEDEVKQKLHSFGFHPADGIAILVQKSLIHISDREIQMHDLIQKMGWNIVRRKANMESGRYSRLWDSDDIIDVLANNTGTVEIEGLVLSLANFKLSEGAFRNMNKLRLLQVKFGDFPRAPNYLPNSLRWLHWGFYPAKSLPGNFNPRHLVTLELPDSSIVQTPDVSGMPNLEVLDLRYGKELLEVHPSVGVHKKLVSLDLSWCRKLEGFPRIIQMESLEILNLEFCSELEDFPEIHSNMSSLRILNLRGTNIEELPWSVGGLSSLVEINLVACNNLKALPSSLCGLKYLESVTLFGCSKLDYIFEKPDDEIVHCLDFSTFLWGHHWFNSQSLKLDFSTFLWGHDHCFNSQPSSMERKIPEPRGASKVLRALLSLPSLQKLEMGHCDLSELIIPESISCLPTLKKLYLGYNKFVSLPETINRFSCLELLYLTSCKMLEALPELPLSIIELGLDNCTALTRIANLVDLLGKYKKLHHLSLIKCKQLVKKPGCSQLVRNQFLSAFWDRRTVSDILSTKQEVVQVFFPESEIPDWLYQSSAGPLVTVTPSPSWYNDKLRGIALCSSSKTQGFQVVTSNGVMTSILNHSTFTVYDSKFIAFLYIPIGKITSGKDWNEQKDYCLFEVTTNRPDTWGIRLVYEGEVDKDIDHVNITNNNGACSHESSKATLRFVINSSSSDFLSTPDSLLQLNRDTSTILCRKCTFD